MNAKNNQTQPKHNQNHSKTSKIKIQKATRVKCALLTLDISTHEYLILENLRGLENDTKKPEK